MHPVDYLFAEPILMRHGVETQSAPFAPCSGVAKSHRSSRQSIETKDWLLTVLICGPWRR